MIYAIRIDWDGKVISVQHPLNSLIYPATGDVAFPTGKIYRRRRGIFTYSKDTIKGIMLARSEIEAIEMIRLFAFGIKQGLLRAFNESIAKYVYDIDPDKDY